MGSRRTYFLPAHITTPAGWAPCDIARFLGRGARVAAGLVVSSLMLTQSVSAGSGSEAGPLQLSLSVEQPAVTFPFPARVKLRLHNSGPIPLWLYRHVRDPLAVGRAAPGREDSSERQATTTGGSTLAVRLEAAAAQPNASAPTLQPAAAMVLESVGLPHPKLVKLLPGADYEETAVVQMFPARASERGKEESVWGDYGLSATYAARFSNAGEIARDLGVTVWQGDVGSNTVGIHLAAAAATAAGSVAGAVLTAEGRPLGEMLVSLSDREERLVGQMQTDSAGRFSFAHLPLGFYWVTARRERSSVDTATFQHVELTAAAPAEDVKLVLLPPEVYQPKQMLHKPVLVRVTGHDGRPAAKVALEIVWSSGTVLDNVKGETSDDGTVALDLLSGRNYVTLTEHGCARQEARMDVAEGGGIDDAALTLDCARH